LGEAKKEKEKDTEVCPGVYRYHISHAFKQYLKAGPSEDAEKQKAEALASAFSIMARPERFELPTAWFVAL